MLTGPTIPSRMDAVSETGLPASGVILAILLLVVSGHPVFSAPSVTPFVFVAMLAWVLLERRGLLNLEFLRRYTWLSLSTGAIVVAQQFQLGVVSVPGTVFFLVKVFIGGLVVSHLGRRFAETFFEAIYHVCASSLFFYGLLLSIGPDAFPAFFSENLGTTKSIGVFTVLTGADWWRNCGPMWEPGALQGVVNLSILLMPPELLKARRYRLRLLTLVVTVITTFSTTGYVTLFILSIYKMSRFAVSPAFKWPAIALMVFAGASIFVQADFLGDKILLQIEESTQFEDFSPDRFGAFLFDMYYIEKHPLVGNGLLETTRYADHPHLWGVALGHGNGISNFAATFGLLGLIGYLAAIVRWGAGPTVGARTFGAFIIAVLSFGEQFLSTPIFLGLPFLMGSSMAVWSAAPASIRIDREPLRVGPSPQAPQKPPQAAA